MSDDQPTITTEEVDRPFKTILPYGATNAGKSWLAGSGAFFTGGRTLVIRTEDQAGYGGFDVDKTEAHTLADFLAIVKMLEAGQHAYKIVAVDTLTRLVDRVLLDEQKREADRNARADPLVPEQKTYMRVGAAMMRLLWRLQRLPLHTVWLCHARLMGEEGDAVKETVPDLFRSLSLDFRASCDAVVYMAQVPDAGFKSFRRTLFFEDGRGPTGECFRARVRTDLGYLPPSPMVVGYPTEEPGLPKLLDLLQNLKKREVAA